MTVPNIEKLKWADIRTVLPNEAHDFTPWLADNLDLLAEILGLEDLVLVGTESAVEEFRLDILATGMDASGSEIAVVMENQYGVTDHDHLGKLVTYAAKAEQDADRVLGVWVVETPRAAHLAAVEFLNRVSNDTVGWFLVSPRFVPGPAGGYFVHFEKHAEPNAFLRTGSRPGTAAAVPEKVEFMHAVFDAADQPLRHAGFRHTWVDPNGSMIRAYLPSSTAASDWAEVRGYAAKNRFRVVLFVRGGRNAPKDLNAEVLEGIKQRHGDTIQQGLGAGAPQVEWHAAGSNDRSDYARVTWETGYADGDPAAAAGRLVEFAAACLDTLRADGKDEFPDPDEFEDTAQKADSTTVMSIAEHVLAGEWTTYGDLSTVASGQPSAAIAVGNMARNNPDFPNPHRVLNAKGEVPAGFVTADGGGPEVGRKRLEGEGVTFLANGTADPACRVPVDELRKRWEPAAPAT